MIQDLAAAEAFLEGLINVERRPEYPYRRLGLDPIRRLLACVSDPHQELVVLHVAGSKGKGSTALLAEAILRAAGLRVGTFTSPHLERWTERFRVDGREVEGSALAAAVERLRPYVLRLRESDSQDVPTFFDVTTAAAFCLFQQAGVDCAVIEVGLGGRLDSTNVVAPRVACITSIELEHTDRLGNTLAAIAGEKAGIIKAGRPLVSGSLAPEAEAVVEARAKELSAPWARMSHDFEVEVLSQDAAGSELRLRDGDVDITTRLPILGFHQIENAALAAACVRRMALVEPERLPGAVREGLASAELPGRIEVLGETPLLVVDSAHTAASARALADALSSLRRDKTHLVLSVSAGKDLDAILESLLPLASSVVLTRAEKTRSLDPASVAQAVRRLAPDTPRDVVPNPFVAVRLARQRLRDPDLLCVAGSVYLAGIARRVLRGG